MKMKWGALVTDGRGKIGGQVASKNRAGAYLRNKVTPVNPSTTFQQTVRNRLAAFSQAWRDLTQAQRDAWNAAVGDYSRTDIFGDLRNPTGFNLYQRLNNNLQQIGVAALSLPPLPQEVAQVVLSAVTYDVGVGNELDLVFTPTIPAGHTVLLWGTPGVSPGKNFVKSEYRLFGTLAAAATSPQDVRTAYEAKFGAQPVGTKVFIMMEVVNNTSGQKGVGSAASTIVVSTV